jgi:tetratricopeptide (TPR) repeat protein
MTKPIVFISYSHKDEIWKNRLVSHLGVLQSEGHLDIWDDRRIEAGVDWYPEIQKAIDTSCVAILLISADSLTSKFILNEEVPRLLERREKEGLRIFPVIIKPCAWKHVQWLARMQARPKDGRPISGGNEHEIDTDMADIADEIISIIKCSPKVQNANGLPTLNPEKISLARLPSTSPELFGREKELKLLDEAWGSQKTNILSLIAWGGVGKTALINVWLNKMCDEHYHGAERVYGWSFYSQGASEKKQVSTDLFIASALEWFGDPDSNKGTPWEKGERLADLIKKKRTLLILDGLEPLQNPPGEKQGQIRDPALKCLLRELAINNSGLCIITSRLEVDDIKDFVGKTVQNTPLDRLSPEAGAQFLQYLGVNGTFDELKEAVVEFDGHALALSLLGRYLAIVYKGDIRQRDKIARLTDEQKQGGHARRVIESYEKWFEGKPELNILRIMGLFDSSADGGAIKAVKTDPPIKGLTSELNELSDENWQYALNNLREAKLLIKEGQHRPDTLDCHPLIREYFGEKLKAGNPDAWKEAHSRLYEYYKSQAKEYPETIEEMTPLLTAVAHGCEAGLHQELVKLYIRRIQRKDSFFITNILGAFGATLSALSGFFNIPWKRPVDGLNESNKAIVLGEVGYCLRSLGRIGEAVQPMQTALESFVVQENWKEAATNALNLSELYLITGDMKQALYLAKRSVELADRNRKMYLRIMTRCALADSLHYSNLISDSIIAFRKAEEMQKKDRGKLSFISSVSGFKYCDLLLSQKKYQVVQVRASRTINIAKQPIDFALDNLSLGRAYLLQAQHDGSRDYMRAADHLNQAVDGLRQAGIQQYLPRGLLARAELFQVSGEFNKARHDLDEAMVIAERGSMGLHQADCHLESARLYLAMAEKGKARESLDIAKKMIEKMGYHLRDKDVTEIEGQL